ncbi:MAG: glycosyl hydrolase family protein [Deltaproteobacteria bacterium]|nr:MAG: glycosyl hydrolase family protein [Deltaproteobacteria bacterium]
MSLALLFLVSLSSAQPLAHAAPGRLSDPKLPSTDVSVVRKPGLGPVLERGPCDSRRGERILFCDDFDEPELSHAEQFQVVDIDGRSRWMPRDGAWNSRQYIHGCELQYYTQYGVDYAVDGADHYAIPDHESNFELDGDVLSLVIRDEVAVGYLPGWMSQPGGSCWMDWQWQGDHAVDTFDYTSGWLRSTQQFKYGRFEIRARIPNEGRVAWPAFWLFGGTELDGGAGGFGEAANEIDIFEFTGYEAHHFTRNLHNYYAYDRYLAMYGDPGDDPALEECLASHWSPTCNFTRDVAANSLVLHHGFHEDLSVDVEDWHTYTLEWSPRGLVWWLDGRQISAAEHVDVPDNFMAVIINNALPDWLHAGINQGVVNGNDTRLDLPASFDIDYVKVTALTDPELTRDWTNGGLDRIDGWYLNANDHHVSGDFDGDGRAELFSLNATSGYAKLMDHEPRQIGPASMSTAGWSTSWSNPGDGWVDGWAMADTDRFLVGDFARDLAGADELLAIQSGTGFAHVMRFAGKWSTLYSNGGTDAMHWWTLNDDDQFVVGDFDGDGLDEVLALNEASGHAHLMRYGRGGFSTDWATSRGQVGSWIFHTDDRFVALDIDGDGTDEILATNAGTKWAQLLAFRDGEWVSTWGNGGSGSVKWWLLQDGDVFRAGEFDGAPGEEVLAYSPYSGWVQILRFDGQAFQHVWGNDGHGRRHDPSALLVGDFAGTGDQLLSISSRHHAYLESYRAPSEVLFFE